MLDRGKYRRIPDLYTTGTELALDEDGTVMWLQVLNDHEVGEARHDAAVARSRLILALTEFGSDERTKLRGSFTDGGRERAIDRLVNSQATDLTFKIIDAIRQDPDWKERLDVLERSDELLSRPEGDPERALLAKIDQDYAVELAERLDTERSYLFERYKGMDEDALYREYEDLYVQRRGGDAGFEEYQITEIWYAARICDAVRTGDRYDHTGCDGHRHRVFETREEVRELPDRLVLLIRDALAALSMTETEAKNSASSRDSSASSRLPSAEEEASTASTPTATPDAPRGSSSPRLATLSPS